MCGCACACACVCVGVVASRAAHPCVAWVVIPSPLLRPPTPAALVPFIAHLVTELWQFIPPPRRCSRVLLRPRV